LDAFYGVNDKQHDVNDLRTADDRADERGVPRAVDQSELYRVVPGQDAATRQKFVDGSTMCSPHRGLS
jgi:hypothetical protein